MCRFTPRRRRLVTSSRASAPRVHTRETPLNFYSIFSRLPLSFYSSIPSLSLAKLYISSRRTCHDHVQRLSLSFPYQKWSNYRPFPPIRSPLERRYHDHSLVLFISPRTTLVSPMSIILSRQYLDNANLSFPFFFILRILRSFPPRTKEGGEGYRELRFRNGREEKKRTEVARHRPLAFDASEWRLNGLQNDGQLHSPLSVAVEGGEVECRRAHS